MKKLFAAGTLVTCSMVAGRLLGFLRESMIANIFGASKEADAAISMLLIPDMITTALIGTAIASALIPAFARRDTEAAKQLFVQVSLLTTMIFSALALLLISQSGVYFDAWIAADNAAAQEAFHLSLLILPISALTAVTSAWLLHNKEFVWFSFATFIYNAVIIAALFYAPAALFTLGVAMVVAALLRLFSQVLSLMWHRVPSAPNKFFPWQMGLPFWGAYMVALGTGLMGLVPQYAPYWVISTSLVTGEFAIFNYGFKLILLPALLLQTLIQTLLMPYLTELNEAKQSERAVEWLRHGFFAGPVAALVLMVLMIGGGQVLASLCFGYGQMSARALEMVGMLVATGSWMLPGVVVVTLLQVTFYARGDTRANVIGSAVQAAFMLLFCYVFYTQLGAFGVMLGVVLSYYVAIVFYALRLRRLGLKWGQLMPADNFVWPVIIMTVILIPVGGWLFIRAPDALLGTLVIIIVALVTYALCLMSQGQYRRAWAAWRMQKRVPNA